MLLQLSTDGVNPFSCNKVAYSMWPIMLSILNLPRNVRSLFGNIMLAGIVPAQADGHEPKNIDPYLEVVVDEILDLSGVTFFDAFKGAPFTFKVSLLNYVLDYLVWEKCLLQQVQLPCKDVCGVRSEVRPLIKKNHILVVQFL